MAKEPFMLVSLKEDKAKKLSHVLSNKTATKILEYLAGKDATETQIAKALKLPKSTVNYNMKQLVDAKLVVAEEFHYSEKGKEVNHYKLANKYIIIAPSEEDESFVDHLKKFLPLFVLVAGVAFVLQILQRIGSSVTTSRTLEEVVETSVVPKAVPEAAPMAMDAARDVSVGSTQALVATTQEVANNTAQNITTVTHTVIETMEQVPWWQSPDLNWIVVGALLMLVVVFVLDYVRKRQK